MKRNRRVAKAAISIAASCAVFVIACGSGAGRAPQPGAEADDDAAEDTAAEDTAPEEQPWIGAISASDRSVVPASEALGPASAAAAPEPMAADEEVDPGDAAPEAPPPEPEVAAPEVTVSATGNDGEAPLANDDDATTWWSPAQDRDVITLSLGAVRSVSEIVIATNTGFTLAGDSAAFADSPLEITSDGESWVAVPLVNFNNLENSCDVSRLSVGSIACGFDPPRSMSQARFEVRQEQLSGVPSVREARIYELDAVLINSP